MIIRNSDKPRIKPKAQELYPLLLEQSSSKISLEDKSAA